MDIAGLKKVVEQDEEGVVTVIYQKNGEPYRASDGSDCTMTVVGSESKKYRDAERSQQRRLFRRARAGGGNVSPEEAEAETIALAAAAVVAWHGWEMDGKPAPCEVETVKKVLAYRHIFEQVNAAVQGHAHFFERSSSD